MVVKYIRHYLLQCFFAPDKVVFLAQKHGYFFLISAWKPVVGYSLQMPHQAASNEHPQYFCAEVRKMFIWYPILSELLHFTFKHENTLRENYFGYLFMDTYCR